MKVTHYKITFFFLLGICFTLASISCGEKHESSEFKPARESAQGFTFFDVGENSLFSKQLRRDLNKTLGSDSIEHRGILDLEINYSGFLKEHFPELDQINQQLNFPPVERVEHRIVKLMYRYAQTKNFPFDYVELVFSEYSQTPLLIKIRYQTENPDTLETLKQKYGPPKRIDWNGKKAVSFYWHKNGNLLILSAVPDRFGNPEHHIVIYFTKTLKELLDAEQTEKENRERDRIKSGKTAF